MMINMIPVSDMKNYNEALRGIAEGSQVVLTQNGKNKYTVVDFDEWQKKEATLKLFAELEKGRISLATEPTYTLDEFKEMYKKYGV